jgi:hypothetical protein
MPYMDLTRTQSLIQGAVKFFIISPRVRARPSGIRTGWEWGVRRSGTTAAVARRAAEASSFVRTALAVGCTIRCRATGPF